MQQPPPLPRDMQASSVEHKKPTRTPFQMRFTPGTARYEQAMRLQRRYKSRPLALVLAIFFGPLGLFYANTTKAGWLTVISFFSLGIGLLICYPLAIMMAMPAVMAHNEQIDIELLKIAEE